MRIFTFCYISIFIGLKAEVGTDWGAYLRIFDQAVNISIFEALGSFDLGYVLLCKVAAYLGYDIVFVNFFISLIFCFGLYKLLRNSGAFWECYTVCIPILIVIAGIGYLRQSAALGFVFFAIARNINSQKALCILVLCFAMMFHKSAAVILLLIILYFGISGVKLYRWLMPLIAVSCIIVVMPNFHTIVKNYLSQSGVFSAGAIPRVLPIWVACIVWLTNQRMRNVVNSTDTFWVFVSWFLLFLLPFVLLYSTLIDRLSLYFYPVLLLVVSRLMTFPFVHEYIMIYRLGLITSSVVALSGWLIFGAHSRYWVPYKNYLLLS